jgi:hypothetical protein
MENKPLRVIFFIENYVQTSINSNIILRKHYRGYEVDMKLKGFDDLENYSRNMDYFEIYILSPEEEDVNISSHDAFYSGISLMMEEKYWIAHEYFEKLWKSYNEPISTFFHSVILFCVAMVHHQMGRESSKYRIFNNARNEMSKFINLEFLDLDFYYPLPQSLIDSIYTFGKEIINYTGLNLNDPSESFL